MQHTQPPSGLPILPLASSHGGPAPHGVAGRAQGVIANLLARPLPPGLYLVATPIGHLGDITLRALATLAAADVIYCEDTRHSRILLAHYAITVPAKPYHEHNADATRPDILAALAAGRRIALISDAGTPLISDPGYKLVRAALDAGCGVTALPGPSAVLTALSVGGLPTDSFHFAGFLPPKSAARLTRLDELRGLPATLVLFEAPSRLEATLADLAERLGDRPIAVARELTKLHETVHRGTARELAQHFAAHPPRGEIVILVAPAVIAAPDDAAIRAHLEVALATMSVRDAADMVATALDVPRGRVYDLALSLKRTAQRPRTP